MSEFVLLDVTTYIGGFNFTTKMNSMALNLMADELDSTTFGNGGYRSRKAGLKDINGELAGYWDDEVDAATYSNLAVTDNAVSMSPTGVEGETAYLWRGEKFSYTAFGAIGPLTPFSVAMSGSHNQGAARGTYLKKQGNVTAVGTTGTAYQISGGIESGFALYSHFHVFDEGTTITAVVESADNEDFDAATTRVTHSALTAVGSDVQRLDGPITDEYFRVRVTTITGTFSVACAIGIGV